MTTHIPMLPAASRLQNHLGQLPWHHRVLGKVASSESHGKFAIDTASNWVPKMLFTTRSAAEAVENTFLEFTESGFFYYTPHNVGEKVFAPVFKRLGKQLPPEVFTEKLLHKSVEEIRKTHPQLLRHVLPMKAALILASIGAAGVAGEYALSFAKNLLTLEAFNKSRFSDIANLTNDELDRRDPLLKAEIEAQNRQVRDKAFKRFKQVAMVTAGLIAGAVGLARFGHRLPGGGKLLENLVKKFDFSFENGRFALSKGQLRALIVLGIFGYLDAARDDLELKEVASRLAVVAPYLMFGNELLMKLLVAPVSKRFPQLAQAAADGKRKNYELGLNELVEESTAKARALLEKAGAKVSEEAVQQKARTLIDPLLRGKNALFFLSFLLGSVGVGLGTTKITQHFTKLRNERQQARRAARRQSVSLPAAYAAYRQPVSNPLPVSADYPVQPANYVRASLAPGTAFQAFHSSLAAASLLSTPSWQSQTASAGYAQAGRFKAQAQFQSAPVAYSASSSVSGNAQ